MRHAIFASALILVVLACIEAAAQQRYEVITVKSVDVQSSVVLLTAQGASSALELQCNINMLTCTALKPGTYVMVRLPHNWGVYVCANAEVYATPAHPGNLGPKLGDYCLSER